MLQSEQSVPGVHHLGSSHAPSCAYRQESSGNDGGWDGATVGGAIDGELVGAPELLLPELLLPDPFVMFANTVGAPLVGAALVGAALVGAIVVGAPVRGRCANKEEFHQKAPVGPIVITAEAFVAPEVRAASAEH